MPRVELVLRYTGCAAIASLVNLATQWMAFRVYESVAERAWAGELMFGIAAGTATGLVSKYLLDKFLIFDDRSLWLGDNLQKFGKYTLTGVLTTAIFWGTEAAFAEIGGYEAMRYLGAAIGLSIGYVVKFHLDYKFVFQGRP